MSEKSTQKPAQKNHQTPLELSQLIGEHEILAICENGYYAIGKTVADATQKARKIARKSPKSFALIPAGSTLDGLCINYPVGAKFVITKL